MKKKRWILKDKQERQQETKTDDTKRNKTHAANKGKVRKKRGKKSPILHTELKRVDHKENKRRKKTDETKEIKERRKQQQVDAANGKKNARTIKGRQRKKKKERIIIIIIKMTNVRKRKVGNAKSKKSDATKPKN